mmetsp:Transcript_8258/g.20817  ORF Transcript_8258/g.20817 Transcript_8258/m.20817 type:complete len:300 (-) Transcript_8258:50-949(-)
MIAPVLSCVMGPNRGTCSFLTKFSKSFRKSSVPGVNSNSALSFTPLYNWRLNASLACKNKYSARTPSMGKPAAVWLNNVLICGSPLRTTKTVSFARPSIALSKLFCDFTTRTGNAAWSQAETSSLLYGPSYLCLTSLLTMTIRLGTSVTLKLSAKASSASTSTSPKTRGMNISLLERFLRTGLKFLQASHLRISSAVSPASEPEAQSTMKLTTSMGISASISSIFMASSSPGRVNSLVKGTIRLFSIFVFFPDAKKGSATRSHASACGHTSRLREDIPPVLTCGGGCHHAPRVIPPMTM